MFINQIKLEDNTEVIAHLIIQKIRDKLKKEMMMIFIKVINMMITNLKVLWQNSERRKKSRRKNKKNLFLMLQQPLANMKKKKMKNPKKLIKVVYLGLHFQNQEKNQKFQVILHNNQHNKAKYNNHNKLNNNNNHNNLIYQMMMIF